MVEALGITIDRRSKGRPRKMESQTIEKNRAYLFKLIIFIRSFGYINKSKRKFKQEKKYGKYYVRSGSNSFELKGEELTNFLIENLVRPGMNL